MPIWRLTAGVHRGGIHPPDIAVGPPVDDVHPAARTVLEHQQAAPVRSSSITASLTESRFSDVVASAMITGL
jgi:hypothetical protein